jgi:hypothetical protein
MREKGVQNGSRYCRECRLIVRAKLVDSGNLEKIAMTARLRNKLRLVCFVAMSMTLSPSALVAAQTTPSGNPRSSCALSDAQREANRAVVWEDFEFGSSDGRPMGLAGHKCYADAAMASRDYLAHGPLLTTRQQAITIFHMGRNLAFAGRENEAAVAVASARRSDQTVSGLDWNTYVQGVYAFLVKDSDGLTSALGKLAGSLGEGNQTNAANLRRLQTCFQQSYLEAMTDDTCASASTAH